MRYWLRSRCSLLVASVLAASCTSSSATLDTGQRITPEFFRYATIVPAPDDGSTGGWRAVCIRARTGQRIANPQGVNLDTQVECGLEFGTPIVNRQHGFISLSMAQRVSAEAANQGAYEVLRRERGVTAVSCIRLRREIERRLDAAINGSTVRGCGTTRWDRPVPEVHWPPR